MKIVKLSCYHQGLHWFTNPPAVYETACFSRPSPTLKLLLVLWGKNYLLFLITSSVMGKVTFLWWSVGFEVHMGEEPPNKADWHLDWFLSDEGGGSCLTPGALGCLSCFFQLFWGPMWFYEYEAERGLEILLGGSSLSTGVLGLNYRSCLTSLSTSWYWGGWGGLLSFPWRINYTDLQ